MSILDDAIREHLELKRAHGADESEVKKLEDEAFGPAERPDQVDPFAEAPTEFLAAPGETADATPGDPATAGRRMPNIADLQEPPPAKTDEPEGADGAPEAPAEEEQPAMEHEVVAQPAPEDKPAEPGDELRPDPEAPGADAAPPAEERHTIAEQPTEMFDVEGQFEDTAESASPTDEQLVDAERTEPRLAPVDPPADIDDSGGEVEVSTPEEEPEDEFDEFFSEQRLSDELNQALEAPLPDEPGAPPTDETPAPLAEEAQAPTTDETSTPSSDETAAPFLDPDTELGPPPEDEDDAEPPLDQTVEQRLPEDSTEQELPAAPPAEEDSAEEDDSDEHKAEPGPEDVLEDTPEFLEDAPEDDELWFEQRPPKDFDFDD